MAKGIFLILPALLIDALQALLSLALMGVFAGVGATASMVPIVGTAAAAGIVPIGILLGFALNIGIGITFGAGLCVLLALSGMFYPRYLVAGGAELIPGLNNLPFWTLFTLLCILRKNREEGGAAASFVVTPARAIMKTKGATVNLPRVQEGAQRVGRRMGAMQERAPLPQTEENLIELARSRERLQDIRAPKQAHAQSI